jgi:hypothetical protein
MRVAAEKQAFGDLYYHSLRMRLRSISSAEAHERLGNAGSLDLNRMSVAGTGQPGTHITIRQRTYAFYIQSPRLQTTALMRASVRMAATEFYMSSISAMAPT